MNGVKANINVRSPQERVFKEEIINIVNVSKSMRICECKNEARLIDDIISCKI